MWPGGLDARYQQAVARPYRMWGRIDVYSRAGALLAGNLPFESANVSADVTRRITRTMTFTLPDADPLLPVFPYAPATGAIDPAATLAPYGNRVRAFAGIEYGDGTRAEFPVFVGRIDTVSTDQTGRVTVACEDLASEVQRAKFLTPSNSTPSNSVWAEFQRLILAAVPDAAFGPSDTEAASALIGLLSWESDRGQALDDMVAGVGCLWWTLSDGRFVLRRPPWSTPGQVPLFTMGDGDSPGQRTFTQWRATVSSKAVNNAVNFGSERLDGSGPLNAVVVDGNAASPTYYLGNYGSVPLIVANQAPLEQQQVDYAARVQLAYAKALTQAWDNISIIPDAAIELGDLALCAAGGLRSQQNIAGYTLDLREGRPMPLTLRAYAPLAGV